MLIPTTITLNQKATKIGYFEIETGIWYIERKKSIHFMRKWKSWGLDYSMYDHLKKNYGISKVIITDLDSGNKVECDYNTIEKVKQIYHFKPHRVQIFVEEKYWKNA